MDEEIYIVDPETIEGGGKKKKTPKPVLGTVSLILGLLAILFSLVGIGFLLAIPAIILGVISFRKKVQIKRSVVGLVLGSLSILISILIVGVAAYTTPIRESEAEYLKQTGVNLHLINLNIEEYFIEVDDGDVSFAKDVQEVIAQGLKIEPVEGYEDFDKEYKQDLKELANAVEEVKKGVEEKDEAKIKSEKEKIQNILKKDKGKDIRNFIRDRNLDTLVGFSKIEVMGSKYKLPKTLEREAKIKAEEEKVAAEKLAIKQEEEKRIAEEKAAAAAEAARIAAEQKAEEERVAYATGITFDQIAREPDVYKGKKMTITGEVVQIMEGTYVSALRVNVEGDYNRVVYVEYIPGSKRFLEGDQVTIKCVANGIRTYETVLGAQKSIPQVVADSIE